MSNLYRRADARLSACSRHPKGHQSILACNLLTVVFEGISMLSSIEDDLRRSCGWLQKPTSAIGKQSRSGTTSWGSAITPYSKCFHPVQRDPERSEEYGS